MNKTASKKAGRSLDEFRAAHDKNYIVPQKIKAGLEKLGDGWEYELEFLKLTGLSTTDLSMFRDQFEDHIVTTSGRNPKRVWTGSKATAKQLREMV
jgi:hypothetical protein